MITQEELSAERRIRVQAEDDRCCVICQDRPKCMVLLPCAHLCLCDHCGPLAEMDACPMCRQPVLTRIRTYG